MDTIYYVIIFVAIIIVIFLGISAISKDKTSILKKAERFKLSADYESAAEIYNNLILKDQFNPIYHALLADVYFITDNFKRAIVEYEIALKSEKDLTIDEIRLIYKNMGIAYFKIKNFPKAYLSLFEAYLSKQSDPDVCLYIGLVYATQRKYDKAYSYLSKAETIDPRNYKLHYYTGIISALIGKKEQAVKELLLARKYKPNDYNLDLYIGAILRDNRDYMNAIRYLKYAAKMINDNDKKMKAFLLLGECYKGIGLIEDAITTLELASQAPENPNDEKGLEMKKNVLYNLGMAYVKGGHASKGVSTWNDLKSYDFFYKDVKELTSSEVSVETLENVGERWMVMPTISLKDILPVGELVSKKLFDIDTLEKTVEKNIGDVKNDHVSYVQKFKNLNIRRFKEVSRKMVTSMGFAVEKEISLTYDADFRDGKATGYIAKKNKQKYLVVIKRYDENVSGVVLLNAIGSAKSMGLPKVVVMITSRYNPDALKIQAKNPNLTLVDRRGMVKALKQAL